MADFPAASILELSIEMENSEENETFSRTFMRGYRKFSRGGLRDD